MGDVQLTGIHVALQRMVGTHHPAKAGAIPCIGAVKCFLLGLCLVVAAPAAATPEYVLPTLFDVTGVAVNDVLNVRVAPSANAAIIGTLSPHARDIEVVGYDETGRWARINAGGRSGWAALRYLAYQVDVWSPKTLPPTLHCRGNEPFWSFNPQGERLIFSTPEEPQDVFRIHEVVITGMFRDPRRAISAQGERHRMTAVIVPMACSDGMSDRAYGLDVTVIDLLPGLSSIRS